MKENCLILNPKKGKTEFVVFASRKPRASVNILIDHNDINQPDFYEYLGVQLDTHLNMNRHLQRTYKRISSRIKLLKKIRHKISPCVAETIFNSMIHPLFFYCDQILGGLSYTWIEKFESLLTRAKKVIKSRKKWSTWSTQRKRKVTVDVFKAVNNITVNDNYKKVNHSINTRGNRSKLILPIIKTEAGRKLSYYQGILIFNSLPSNIREEKCLLIFKNHLKSFDF
jgi:hypothetical protein